MCGRQCLSLAAKDIICACKYSTEIDGEKETIEPVWRAEYNLGKKYIGSTNIAPTEITPVLVSAQHFDDIELKSNQRVLVTMMWGMIPIWHKGDYRKHGLSTNNCRLESMLTSKLYSRPFKTGQRCVVLCEGFYEWQTTKPVKKSSERAAYFIHAPQATEDVKIYDRNTWADEANNGNIRLLKMAGLYDIWTDDNGDKIYSYSVITYESNKLMSWLHDRLPAILETEEQVDNWLNYSTISCEQALAALTPPTNLLWYQVSKAVNNSRNKLEICNHPIGKDNKPNSATNKRNMLTSWLVKTEVKRNRQGEEGSEAEKSDEGSTQKKFKQSE